MAESLTHLLSLIQEKVSLDHVADGEEEKE
jgi:hypothetical protein